MSDDTLYGILLIAVVLGSLVTIGVVAARRRARSEGEEDSPPRSTPAPAQVTPTIGGRIMSRLMGAAGAIDPVADRLRATPQNEVQGFANRRNPVNEKLTAQPLAQPTIPDDVRDIIRFWTRIEAVESIIAGGKVGMVEAIELIFECKRNGRPDSVYGRARAAIQTRERPQYQHQLTPEQQQLRKELALDEG